MLGDPDALIQIKLILLDNALKHSQGAIRITAEMEESQVSIRVSVEGPGIAPEILPHVFDRFYRGEVDPSFLPGFGLGLPIAKALVEGQNGTIEIESATGHGSTVRVRLPVFST